MRASPLGSSAGPEPSDAAKARLTLDLPGRYLLELRVRDGHGCGSAPASVEVAARPAEQLLVELVWNNPATDLDVHLVPEGQDYYGPLDCYFADGHRRPDWGVSGDASDDPSLVRDALHGYGPELVSYPSPAPGRYRAMVSFYSAHRSPEPATEATLRVYEFGVVRSERRRALTREGQQWEVVTIDWPGGAIGVLDRVTEP